MAIQALIDVVSSIRTERNWREDQLSGNFYAMYPTDCKAHAANQNKPSAAHLLARARSGVQSQQLRHLVPHGGCHSEVRIVLCHIFLEIVQLFQLDFEERESTQHQSASHCPVGDLEALRELSPIRVAGEGNLAGIFCGQHELCLESGVPRLLFQSQGQFTESFLQFRIAQQGPGAAGGVKTVLGTSPYGHPE